MPVVHWHTPTQTNQNHPHKPKTKNKTKNKTKKTKQVRNLVAENMIAKLRVRCKNNSPSPPLAPSTAATGAANPSEVRIYLRRYRPLC